MEKNTILFNGKITDTFVEKSSMKISYLLGKQKKLGYFDNPPVAAVVNGELKSLQDEIEENAVINLVYLNSKTGRTVYRRTLCFLLSYAASVVYPERTLISGHSLGDGYYFYFRDKEKSDISRLKEVMRQAVEDEMVIDIERLSSVQALEYVRSHGLIETEKLLQSRNDGAYIFNRLGDCRSVNYEPLISSVSLLSVWDLMEYGEGMLLRYPQSRKMDSMMAFQDNPLLFKVFEETRAKARILDVDSLGSLNIKEAQGKIREVIVLSETLQRRSFYRAAEDIRKKGGVRIVFISGPACSGKKTSGLKLCAELTIQGFAPVMLSLDDYRKKDENGKSYVDTAMLQNEVKALLNGEEVTLTSSESDTKRLFRTLRAKMNDNSILVIEGVQTLNEHLIPNLNENEIYRIFVSALTQLNLDTCSNISTRDNRLLRRIVKECRKRDVSPADIINSWDDIEEEEKNLLFPYQNNADMMINSALEYELGVLYSSAMPLLRSVRLEDGMAYTTARRLMAFLELVNPISPELVPSDSVLREFIGGSAFLLS
jgi:uridine kinase